MLLWLKEICIVIYEKDMLFWLKYDTLRYLLVPLFFSAAEIQCGDEALDRAAVAIRRAYIATDPDYAAALEQGQSPVLDIAVSFPGTWMKRGFSSLYGVGVCIELLPHCESEA